MGEVDLLNILDDFLSNKEKDLSDFERIVMELNEYKDLEFVAKKYKISGLLLVKKLEKLGFVFSNEKNKWIYRPTSKRSEFISGNKQESLTEKVPTIKSINITQIVEKLSNGMKIEEVADELNMCTLDLFDLLQNNDYMYYDFANFWTNLSERELVENFVKELNNGLTFEQLFLKYTKAQTKQTFFIGSLKNLLSKYHYVFDNQKKKWVLGEQSLVQEIVSLLNHGVGFQEIEEIYEMDNTQLRMLLKEHKYRYDFLYNIWTNRSERELLMQTSRDLILNNKSWDDFVSENGINKELLYKKLKEFKIEKSFAREMEEKNEPKNTYETPPNLSVEEIKIIRLMIQDWMQKNQWTEKKGSLRVFLPVELLLQFEHYCEFNDIAKSKVVQKLIEDFLKTKSKT
ncbi:hypothetical protein [Anoxybacillus sp. MB8]|uniref:hypothetical protein n=1 Tax=Anoxybacillus sp. MB8 TaxID=2496850 RepID=UPI00196A18A7|nr:hypothetical protein [Anoxybacillus sp. MB8]